VEHTLEVMAQTGAAGLSLGEVARRMHMRTPSLYVYFSSKAALYDEVFARGWQAFGEAMQEYDGPLPEGTTLREHLSGAMTRALHWASAHPAYSQLMFWRPVPRWEPSPRSYASAVALEELTGRVFDRLLTDGHLRPGADAAEAAEVWTVMVSGLVSQRLSNEPHVPVTSGRMTALVDPLVSSFVALYGSRSS
jgi:AcrR family transcriptional regulator